MFLCLTVDDGTGLLPCVDWLNSRDGDSKRIFELGMLVDLQGKLSEYRGQKQVTIELIGTFPISLWYLFTERKDHRLIGLFLALQRRFLI